VTFSPAQTAEVAEVPGGPQISATMVDFDDKAATLKISLTENGKVLAEPTLRTIRGERAVVGTRNGPAAPYVFLLIEPLEAPAFDRAGARKSGAGDIVIPQAIKRVQPAYPEEARKAKLEGVVLLECTVGADGRVKGCRASRREPLGLTDAAIAAVSQWEFEPARDGAGQPIEVMMTITIRFALS
jgi:TonB family protein